MPSPISASSRGVRLAHALLGAALVLPLLVYASVGSFARYTADDYCWAGILRTEGFFRAQMLWYVGYSPRYAFTFLVNLVELAGPSIVPALPAIAIVTCLVTLTWSLAQFGLGSLRAVLLAEVAAVAAFQTAPDLPQSLYWQTGMLTYLLPLILAAFLVGWLRRAADGRPLTWWSLAMCSGVTFVAGGLSETYLIPQNVALTLALLACLGVWLRSPRPTSTAPILAACLAAALAGGVVALVVIVVAPSTASRVDGTPADLWLASAAAIATGVYQLVRLARYFLLTVVLVVGLSALLWNAPARLNRTALLLVSAGVAITLPFCYFPSFYAQNGNPPARSLIVPGAIMIGYLVYLGYALRGAAHAVPLPGRALATAGLALVPIGIALVSLPDRAEAAQHAALWDAEDQQIRASRDAGQTDVTVPTLPRYLGEDFVTANRADWFNACVARYYGVRSIAAAS